MIAGSLLLVFAVGEVGVRLLQRDMQAPGERPPPRPAVPEEPDLPVFTNMFELGRRNVRGVHKRVLFRTNSQALRGPEYAADPSPGVFRIAIGGDSVTMGEGVPEEATYARRLEERLDASHPGRRHEVLNVGLSGSDARYVVERLEAAADHYSPHLLIYGFTVNDLEGPSYEKGRRGNDLVQALRQSPFASSPSRLVRFVWWRLQSLRDPPDPKQGWYARELLHNAFENPAAWADFEAALDRFRALADRHGVCGHVFVHTHLSHLDETHPYTEIYDAVARAARARGLSVTTSLEAFLGRRAPPLWVGFFDPHPNAQGHAILADRLAEGLARLPERCWRREGA